MSKSNATKRRTFLKMGLGGAAASVAAPYLWIPRISKAAMAVPSDRDNHLLLINLDGGARTAPLFNADLDGRWNPYGVTASNTEFGLGGVFANAPYQDTVGLGMSAVPSISEIAAEMAVLATVDHVPGAASGEGGHIPARNWIASGYGEGGPGIMSHIYALHKNYTQGSSGLVFPPVVIGGGGSTPPFAAPRGTIEPIRTDSFAEFAQQSGTGDEAEGQPDWARAFEGGLDEHTLLSRSAKDRERIARLAGGKENVEAFRAVFTDPALKVADAPDAVRGGISNAQLQAIFGTTIFGRNAALATRFLLERSVAVLLADAGEDTGPNWDTHSGEINVYMNQAQVLERVLCGLNYVLKMAAHPAGGTFWDRTVVAIITEFGRDNVMDGGYNSGGGSDHVGGPGMRNQAYFLMGGPVGQKGAMFGSTDPVSMERMDDVVFSTQQYLATFLAFLDIDYSTVYPSAMPIDVVW